MPESSFFDPLNLPQVKPRFSADPAFRAGYRNVYGTQIGASVSPVTNQGSLDFQFPIGDHQRQNFITGGAYVRPGSAEVPPDYGFKLGFTKKIQPQGLSGGELINRAVQQQLGAPNSDGAVLNASNRSDFIGSLTPDQLKMLGQDVRKINRDYIDQKLGIVPGVEKYGFGIGVDVKQKPQMPQWMESVPTIDPKAFAQGYAENLPGSKRKPLNIDYGQMLEQ